MVKEITQKSSSGDRKYTIQEEGLYVEIKTTEGFTARLLKYEDIGFEEIITKYTPGPVLVSLFVSVFLNIILLLIFLLDFTARWNISSGISSGIAGGIIVLLSVWGRIFFKFEKQKILKGDVSIVFDYFKKNQKEVDLFIQELKARQREYIRTKYMVIDDYRPIESQKSIFFWLYEAKYITKEEIQELMDKLERKVIIKGF